MSHVIKIKMYDCEYSLETSDNSIVEKELDAYFACLFDVSDEFRANIKKVEIKSDKVVSIEELEKQDKQDDELQELSNDDVQQTVVSEKVENPEPVINEQQTELAASDTVVEQSEAQVEQPLQQQDEIETIIQENKSEFMQPENTKSLNSLLDDFNKQSDEILNKNNVDDDEKEKEPLFIQPETLEIIDDSPTIGTAQGAEEGMPDINFIENNMIPPRNPNRQSESVESRVQNAKVEDFPIENTQVQDNQTENVETAQNQQEEQKVSVDDFDFKFFLAGFIISDMTNQFLACAYYIKNVLKEPDFTIKSINQKLFKATKNIADLSVVTTLYKMQYITFHTVDGVKKYMLTDKGEEYFVKKYQE